MGQSADGRRVAAGTEWNDENGNWSGQDRVFSYDSDTQQWAQLGPDIDGEEAADDRFGYLVSLSSSDSRTDAAASAVDNDENDSISGHVIHWVQAGAYMDGELADDEFEFQ